MRIIAKTALRNYWEKHPDAEQPLRAWHGEAENGRLENARRCQSEVPIGKHPSRWPSGVQYRRK